MDCFRPKDRLNEIYERELNELKKLTVHRELAIAAGIDYCAEQNICAPPWLVKEASLLICDLLKREKVHKRGRSGGLIARYRQDMWDVERWDAVEEVRRTKKKAHKEMEIMRSYKPFRRVGRAQP